jgi:hypothetical protein
MLLFFAGLILSIPLTLAVNLTTPWAQNRMARRSAARAAGRSQSLKRELANVHQYAITPDKLNRALLSQILRISLVTSIGTALVTGCFAAANVVQGAHYYLFTIHYWNGYVEFYLDDVFNFLGFLLGTIAAIIVIPLCLNALRLRSRADNFADYSKGVEKLIGDLDSSQGQQ